MNRIAAVALLLSMTTAAVILFSAWDRGALTVISMAVQSAPSRGRCVEFLVRNNSTYPMRCRLYRQQLFADHWAPQHPERYRPDEDFYIEADSPGEVTIRIPDSGGQFRFHIIYGEPAGWDQRFAEEVRKKLGLRRKGLRGTRRIIITDPIQVPPA